MPSVQCISLSCQAIQGFLVYPLYRFPPEAAAGGMQAEAAETVHQKALYGHRAPIDSSSYERHNKMVLRKGEDQGMLANVEK